VAVNPIRVKSAAKKKKLPPGDNGEDEFCFFLNKMLN
jgi:hypothetical protein